MTQSQLSERIAVGGVILDLGGCRIERGRRTVGLTASEVELLRVLWGRRGRLVPYAELVSALHPSAAFDCGRARLKFTVAQLRRKLGRARSCLETVFGQGLLLRVERRGRGKGVGLREAESGA
jgi:DNA-binding response OmpR family regulator